MGDMRGGEQRRRKERRGEKKRRREERGTSMKRRICRIVPDRTLSVGKIRC